MARVRNLSPKFFKDAAVLSCKPLTRIFFQGLWCEADRAGRLRDRPDDLVIEILPRDKVSGEAMLEELVGARLIVRYEVDGERFIQIRSFARHQHPHQHEAESRIPPPPPEQPPAAPSDKSNEINTAGTFQDDSGNVSARPAGSGKRAPVIGIERTRGQLASLAACSPPPSAKVARPEPRFQPPTLDQVEAWFGEKRAPPVEAERFVAYYRANGWRVGRNPMKDWKAAAAGWLLRARERG